MENSKRLYIFTGHYGSGKTEVSVNFARMLNKRNKATGGRKVAIIDMDIINPFFRTADSKELLESEGIRVELPVYANTNVDVPALTADMGALIRNKEFDVVLDIGGDDLGAKAVGFYAEDIKNEDHIMYFVMNPYRPFTGDVESAVEVYNDIEESAGIGISGIVNNSNLLEQTSADTVLKGYSLVKEVAKVKKVPVLMHTAFKDTASELIERNNAQTDDRPSDLSKDLEIASLPYVFGAQLLSMDECVKLLWKRGEA